MYKYVYKISLSLSLPIAIPRVQLQVAQPNGAMTMLQDA